jgi:hypothetical protein
MCARCVRKDVFILILGSIYKNNLLVTSSFLYKYFLSSSSSLPQILLRYRRSLKKAN